MTEGRPKMPLTQFDQDIVGGPVRIEVRLSAAGNRPGHARAAVSRGDAASPEQSVSL
jgi:hypothetical protein